jgi:ribosome-binding protein aMBF1 (putative translation factor)
MTQVDTIGRRVREIRKKQGISQEDLALPTRLQFLSQDAFDRATRIRD